MAKMTLLDIVQDILNDTDGDEVNSINDTAEAIQIANVVKTTYEEIISNRDWPHLKTLVQLTSSGVAARPTHMTIADTAQRIYWIKYDKRKTGETKKVYQDITYLEPDVFILKTNSRNNDSSDIDVITDSSGVDLFIKNDIAPTYYTSFDDETLVFDSYDSVVDTDTMIASKTQAYIFKRSYIFFD